MLNNFNNNMTWYSRQLAYRLTASYTNNSWALPTSTSSILCEFNELTLAENRAPSNES